MYESISKNNELENEMTLDMSYFWYSDAMDASDNLFDSNILLPKVLYGVIVMSTTWMVQISLLFLIHFRAYISLPVPNLGHLNFPSM